MPQRTLTKYVDSLRQTYPQRVWLRDRQGDDFTDWSFAEGYAEIAAAASWIEQRYGASQTNIAILSRNRAHWILADLAIISSGNVSVPLFTTLVVPTAEYIFDFTETRVLILGESQNWDSIQAILPESIDIVTMPGVEVDGPHIKWDDLIAEFAGQEPEYDCNRDDLISIVFTSGTTGVPKGVMQSHDSMLIPMQRAEKYFELRDFARFLSYLPLSHIAERQLVMVQSLIYMGTITFNESLETLLRDMADTRPNYFFGAPRVWEQLQQALLAKFGSQQALDAALVKDADEVGLEVRKGLGLDDADYLLTGAAPIPPALLEWYAALGLGVREGYGQTEIMGPCFNTAAKKRIGSIGQVVEGAELKITEEGELAFRAEGPALGYYKMPEKTAETFIDGWVYTGDKGYVDDDGFVFITGRVKDYFKTIQAKFVAPAPIENSFSENEWTEQLCLLGRGYSKTAMVCVLSESAQKQGRGVIEEALRKQAQIVNEQVDKHARIGAVLVSTETWTIENEMLTPTLKIRRDEVEGKFGERARELAHDAAVQGVCIVEWMD